MMIRHSKRRHGLQVIDGRCSHPIDMSSHLHSTAGHFVLTTRCAHVRAVNDPEVLWRAMNPRGGILGRNALAIAADLGRGLIPSSRAKHKFKLKG